MAMLSFGKLALWAELDPRKWPGLLGHSIVKGLFQGNTREFADNLEEVGVDDLKSFDELIYDADSSQHNALLDVLSGRTLVINGPPGTGKSQTITNIIASSLVAGKSALFVAEKLAALEVVKSRLEEAGLGDFCLELHSHKTQKKKLLEDIDTRMKGKYRVPPDLPSKRKSLLDKRETLRRYVETLNMVVGNELEKTVFEILWAVDRRRGELGELARHAERITLPFAVSVRSEQLEKLRTVVDGLSRHYIHIQTFGPAHPWFGFHPTTHPAGLQLEVKSLLENQSSLARDLQARIDALCGKLEMSAPAASRCRFWVDVVSGISHVGPPPSGVAGGLIVTLFAPGQTSPVQAVLDELARRIEHVRALEARFRDKLVAGARVTDEVVSSIHVHLNNLEQLGLTDRRLVQLRELPHTLRAEARELGEVLDGLQEVVEIAGFQFEGSLRDLRHVRDAVNIARIAPTDLLAYRSRSFETPGIAAQLAQAKKQAFDLRQLRTRLAESLYLDQEPDRRTLQQAISALREGDGILQWFNGAWRKARKLHLSVSISKERKSAKERAEDVSEFARLLAGEKAFDESAEYAAAFGQLFSGVATEWAKIEQLATWYHVSQQILMETDVPAPSLDLTAIPAARLGQLKARAQLLETKLESLDRSRAGIVRSLGERPLVDPTTRRQKNWKVVVKILRTLSKTQSTASVSWRILSARR